MSSYRVRDLREEDAETVAALFAEAWGESRAMDAGEIREWLRNEALAAENLQVLVQDDRVVGYFDLWFEGDRVNVDPAAPGHWDAVFDEAERRARDAGVRLVHTPVADGHPVGEIARRRGYRAIRGSYVMEIDLGDEAPPEAAPPDGIEIRPYRHPEDEQRTFEAQEEAFADHWGHHPQTIEQWREFTVKARGFDPSLWFLAWDGGEVAGVVLNWLERADQPDCGWVATLGVRRSWRRRGIGEALLRRSFAALHARGRQRVRLSVDAESTTGATRLYERAGMHVARRSSTWELEL